MFEGLSDADAVPILSQSQKPARLPLPVPLHLEGTKPKHSALSERGARINLTLSKPFALGSRMAVLLAPDESQFSRRQHLEPVSSSCRESSGPSPTRCGLSVIVAVKCKASRKLKYYYGLSG
uniref:Uncharacterized protein n=1 Tax=Mycena chlorophos TaxID=658473 RepID=A0ABQ0M2N8_MYCCL|nr:predicted protein [Mycena chlorophos]